VNYRAPDSTAPAILELVEAFQYLPLSLFTTENRILLGLRADEVAKKTVQVAGTKHSIIDVSTFENEEEMSEGAWRDALEGYYIAMRDIGGPPVENMFRQHFSFLLTRQDFQANFEAVRKFDVDMRRRWFNRTFVFDESIYFAFWHTTCAEVKDTQKDARIARMEAAVFASAPAASRPTVERTRSSNRDARASPYASAAATRSGTPSGPSAAKGQDSFRSKKICGQCFVDGHTAGVCPNQKTFDGRDLFVRWDGARRCIVTKSGGEALCLFFNISAKGCNKDHAALSDGLKHACCLCGSADHSGLSGACSA
jgi:hypothetical protein